MACQQRVMHSNLGPPCRKDGTCVLGYEGLKTCSAEYSDSLSQAYVAQSPQGCPSCDLDLSYPGQPGHLCYTYEAQAERVRLRKEQDAELSEG